MHQQIIKDKVRELDEAVERFKIELGKIRPGRASASMVEHLLVNYYGSKSPLVQLASISVPEPRQLLIQPWNRDDLVSIESAIRESDLGFNPNNDGSVIRKPLGPTSPDCLRLPLVPRQHHYPRVGRAHGHLHERDEKLLAL